MFNTNAFLTRFNKSMLLDNKVLICDLECTTISNRKIENSHMIKDFPFYRYDVDILGDRK